jgi:hypothetical protein
MDSGLPRLYTDLASWYYLLTAPEDYVEEAAFYAEAILSASSQPPRPWIHPSSRQIIIAGLSPSCQAKHDTMGNGRRDGTLR